MEERGTYLRVGALIVGGMILLLALVWFLAGNQFTHGTLYESYFSESVQGLDVGGDVKFRGVTVGRVTGLGLVSAEYGGDRMYDPARQSSRLVFVRFEIDTARIGRFADTPTAVSQGLRVRLATQGLTGLSYLELDFVDPKQYPALQVPWQPTAQYIPSMPSTLTQVQDAATALLQKLNQVDIEKLLTQATDLVAALHGELADGGDIHEMLAAATQTLRDTDAAVRDADLAGLTADLKRTSATLRDTVGGRQVQKLLTDFDTAAARLPALIASLQAVSQRANNSTSDVEQSLGPLLRDLQATTQNLRDLTGSLRRYPAQVFGQPPPRTGPGQ
jgi:ABC-type transporter Mla subunit MlaD